MPAVQGASLSSWVPGLSVWPRPVARADNIIERDGLFAAVHGSGFDAVDGSSIGTRVPRMWALLRLPRFKGASHADGHDDRF